MAAAEKRRLALDFETFSSVPIADSGAFKYIESPDFEILLMSYAYDDEPVQCVDLAAGEKIPRQVAADLYDPGIIKTAWNAAFERECLHKRFGKLCPPEQWEDTMILTAQCGLPLKLSDAGEALGLSEDKAKMKEGSDLLRYFCIPCKPTRTNGGRDRNRPSDAPEKWETFKAYNIRDVEVERTIRDLLERWAPSEREHDLWCLDQRINGAGMRIDPELVENAIRIGEDYKAGLLNEATSITGIENPNSVSQIKTWLQEQEGVEVVSLNKKVVADVVAQLTTDTAKEFMALRREFSKSSAKKYDAMLRAACADDHVRGCFQFYGANRTGRWCLTGDHEILTDHGWQRLDAWGGGRIACWAPHGEMVSFQAAKQLVFPYKGPVYWYEDKRISQVSTPDHKMYVKMKYGGEWTTDTVENMAKHRPHIPFTGYRQVNAGMEHNKLRVIIMIQADGHYCEDGAIKLAFTKIRKVERCKRLLRAAGITFTESTYPEANKPRYVFYIPSRAVPLWLRQFRDKTFGSWLFDESADVFFDELVYWDGYRSATNSIQYSTCNKQNADMVQALAHLSGRSAVIRTRARSDEHPTWSDAYYVDIWLTPKNCHEIRAKPTIFEFGGLVYCAETPTGYFLVRRNGRVWVTGNSGRLVQLQNIPQNHMPDLAVARELVRRDDEEGLRWLYPDVASTLSELLRTALIPEDGHRFIVADYSAIEARVIAWIAGERWRLDVFKEGGDIYCASASQMFHVPVEKHGQNSHLRQKGKIAELALGYGGGVNALKAFGADKMGMTDEEMVETVDLWRASSPHICALWRSLEKAAIRAVAKKTTSVSTLGGVPFSYENGVLWMTLPSGRRIAYWGAEYTDSRWNDRKCLTYMGQDQTTKKWTRLETWGGKLTENLVQATARDCLRDSMLALAAEGYDIRAHVHDECIITEPVGGRSVDEVCEVMGRPLTWAPGLPLRADGYETPFYMKD